VAENSAVDWANELGDIASEITGVHRRTASILQKKARPTLGESEETDGVKIVCFFGYIDKSC